MTAISLHTLYSYVSISLKYHFNETFLTHKKLHIQYTFPHCDTVDWSRYQHSIAAHFDPKVH